MKILHTADLHLHEAYPERWVALEELVRLAREREITTLVIAGDLFDQNVDAERLRPKLRETIGTGEFETIILPGNHDYKAYRSGLYFGENVRIITDWEEPIRLENTLLWGLPYTRMSGERLVTLLREMGARMHSEDNNILIYHGELLDAYYSRQDLGDEGEQRYMPVKLSYFETLPLQYVLAGHFHSRYTSWQLPGGGLYIYPGSPVAVTRRETGRRKANLLISGEPPAEIILDTFHYEELRVKLDPLCNEDPRGLLRQKLRTLHPAALILLTVEGFYNGAALGIAEEELVESIKQIAGARNAEGNPYRFMDVRHVLEDDLYKYYQERVEQEKYPPDVRERMTEMIIRAIMEVKGCS
ncbi:MAG TPA: metallophosphoesterase [Candidatus Limnocylindrales bacterium]|nr:metallophosphoesterase [Candidatus Limnocylindrales bacterium]